jgi:hypothetical protein
MEVYLHVFLSLALDESKWLVLLPAKWARYPLDRKVMIPGTVSKPRGRESHLSEIDTVRLASSSYLKQKQTQWTLHRKRTLPTERPPLVDEI